MDGRIRGLIVAAALALGLPWPAASAQPALQPSSQPGSPPPCVERLAQPVQALGSGTLRWFGLRIYDAALWSEPGGVDPARLGSQPLALRLRYDHAFSGRELADASAKLMRGDADAAVVAQWQQRMRAVFPDVHPGDTLCGVYLPHADGGPKTWFLSGGRLLGSVAGEDFARAFFGIWLGPTATHTDLRRQLLGGARP